MPLPPSLSRAASGVDMPPLIAELRADGANAGRICRELMRASFSLTRHYAVFAGVIVVTSHAPDAAPLRERQLALPAAAYA